ncbi:hypothetical protein [Flavobacterium sp.]|uniref:hypothetical protein n=1 Tax=Flavobacterium sp. TaxID=239 RepID=UPI00261876F7|nr:hypothetical protein [Flavobacterium sp.]
MKTKKIFLSAIITLTFLSCSKDDLESSSQSNQSEKTVLNFANAKEMQSKIDEIEAFKISQEEQIMQKLLQRSNLKAPTLVDVKNAETKNLTEVDKNAILEDVKFYHQEKLKAIYSERAHFGFTSIQSIADEINFSKLIDTELNNKLINNYKNLFFEFNHQYVSIYDKISLVAQPNKNISISGKVLNLRDHKISLPINNAQNRTINEGIVCSGYNNFIQITYHCTVGASVLQYDLAGNTWVETYFNNKLSCLVLSNAGYVLYQCYFFTNPGSKANYLVNAPSNAGYSLSFPSGIGSQITSFGVKTTGTVPQYVGASGNVGGTFSVQIGNTGSFLSVSGTKYF